MNYLIFQIKSTIKKISWFFCCNKFIILVIDITIYNNIVIFFIQTIINCLFYLYFKFLTILLNIIWYFKVFEYIFIYYYVYNDVLLNILIKKI